MIKKKILKNEQMIKTKHHSVCILLFTLVLLLSVTACNNRFETQSETILITDETKDAWQNAYALFLKDWSALPDEYVLVFSLRDLDQDSIPELLIRQGNEKDQTRRLFVYSYDDGVCKIGECDDPNSFAGTFLFSDHLEYPGLFSCKWGGGIERYGYLSIKDNQLVYEDLWLMDRTLDTPEQKDISNNKELINESINLFEPNEYDANILEEYPISMDGIKQVFEYRFVPKFFRGCLSTAPFFFIRLFCV
ncbi:MAG: hypothetical protein IKZ59_00785 [Clostridia bacterium]|nr:hypothetical protein [Clostridia bacterium]